LWTRRKLGNLGQENFQPSVASGRSTVSSPPQSSGSSQAGGFLFQQDIWPDPATVTTSTVGGQNNNLVGIDKFLSALEDVGRKEGYDSAQISTMKSTVLEKAATSPDYRRMFLNEFKKSNTINYSEPLGISFLKKNPTLFSRLTDLFGPLKAYAYPGQIPFGGQLFYSYFCECSANFLLTIQPLPPTHVQFLSYYLGTQAYLSYNIPRNGIYLLGLYRPGAVCITGGFCAVTLPTTGLITPVVGSSPVGGI
jgi:hypothetical protein